VQNNELESTQKITGMRGFNKFKKYTGLPYLKHKYMFQIKGSGSKLSPNLASSVSAISDEKSMLLWWKNILVNKFCAILHALFTGDSNLLWKKL
jgi:hypothetical protein